MVRKVMESRAYQGVGLWFRRGAGVMIALLGGFFIVNPFIGGPL
jgi:cytochrome c-type biogenesis protein